MSVPAGGAVAGAEFAYYFSEWRWPKRSIDFMKSMLLFFDGLALALPPELATEMIDRDPVLAVPLAERDLLVNFDPATQLDAAADTAFRWASFDHGLGVVHFRVQDADRVIVVHGVTWTG